MKIYNPTPDKLVRINIKKQGEKTHFITLCETTPKEVMDFVKGIIMDQRLSPFEKGKVTNIEIREAIGGKNGKSISISFKGLSPAETKFLIQTKLNLIC